jgi:hypothetical protein
MKTVFQIMSTANPERVGELYVEHHRDDGWHKPESFRKFCTVLADMVSVKPDDVDVVVLEQVEEEAAGFPNGYIHVSGYPLVDGKPGGQAWSLSLTRWEEWKGMKVHCPEGLDDDRVAMEIYYEMTFHGWPEQQREFGDSLLDTVEGIERGLGETIPFDPYMFLDDGDDE